MPILVFLTSAVQVIDSNIRTALLADTIPKVTIGESLNGYLLDFYNHGQDEGFYWPGEKLIIPPRYLQVTDQGQRCPGGGGLPEAQGLLAGARDSWPSASSSSESSLHTISFCGIVG